MSTIPVQIVRRQDNALADAVLHTELAPTVLIETEKEWGPIRREAARKLLMAGRTAEVPQQYRWDWGKKSPMLELLAYRCFGIEYDSKYQGLLLLKLAGVRARLQPDQASRSFTSTILSRLP